jgi:DNA polymerase alpha-associated DNA helicase A
MQKLQDMPESGYSSFIRVLFGLSSPSPVLQASGRDPENIDWIDPSLNDSQKEAVQFALASREVALIHGPPGVRPLRQLSLYVPRLTLLSPRLERRTPSSNSSCR